MLPPQIASPLREILGAEPDQVRIQGGMAPAARIVVSGEQLLVKWSNDAPPAGWPDQIAAEGRGLLLLARSGAVRVPELRGFVEGDGERPSVLVMAWVDGGRGRSASGELLGRQLAALHRVTAEHYGLDFHTYCGATPQNNTQERRWITFYGEHRLRFQLELAAQRGLMPSQRRQRLELLIERLDAWIDESCCVPSLIHGDLWGGNWLADAAGAPLVIDPAISYSDREAELAMCHLFGGFPPAFYAAYDEVWPPAPGRDERIPLYQQYHLLNHLNIFGEGYGGQVDAILRRYVGAV